MNVSPDGGWVATTYGVRVRDALLDLREFTEMAARVVERGQPAYQRDETLRLAAEAITHRIGEAVNRLSDAYLADQPLVPWRQIRAMRNLVAHDYGRVDHQMVWNTLVIDLPSLAAFVRADIER